MKIVKNMLLLAMLTSLLSVSKLIAQPYPENFSIGIGGGYVNHAKNLGASPSFNLRLHYYTTLRSAIMINYNTQIPLSLDYGAEAKANSSTTTPSTTPVDVKQKIATQYFSANYQIFLAGKITGDMGLYTTIGMGYAKSTLSETLGSYNSNLYTFNAVNSEEHSSYMLDLGVGGHFKLSDKFSIYSELKIASPFSSEPKPVQNAANTYPVQINYGLQVGLRYIPFF